VRRVAFVPTFLTSANFTESAHERNIELGVLLRDNRMVAGSNRPEIRESYSTEFLKPLPLG
jgi:phosphatidylserine/phosphatidylglycerophosphate/cardiolipin synthase-like enzyme